MCAILSFIYDGSSCRWAKCVHLMAFMAAGCLNEIDSGLHML